ncbi:hypothetical protein AWZ87_15660 [Shigella sonnei]|uniref:hypothetical protein n=1 Tax=Shigella sonnei TaxID=624 RepID=UPI00080F4CE8|nr:hypothetical protein [Shigella sonnei]OCD43605.1 hypothetical protein AWZ87_15660 [Shigella sonnei]
MSSNQVEHDGMILLLIVLKAAGTTEHFARKIVGSGQMIIRVSCLTDWHYGVMPVFFYGRGIKCV